MLIMKVVTKILSIYTSPDIYTSVSTTTRQIDPQLSTFICTCMQHVNIPVTTTNSPLDRQLDGHALTTHTYLGVEAIDPYITIQANGTHATARRMDDEIETTTFPQVNNYISHLKVLMWATRDVITSTL